MNCNSKIAKTFFVIGEMYKSSKIQSVRNIKKSECFILKPDGLFMVLNNAYIAYAYDQLVCYVHILSFHTMELGELRIFVELEDVLKEFERLT
jgi:hypothetical protein